MNYFDFRRAFASYPAFSTRQIEIAFPGFDRKILVAWQSKGYIHRIRNSWYCFADPEPSMEDLLHIANRIYAPSYVSLEFALSHYQLIPEGTFTITSVSSLKTNSFQTPIGSFIYRHVKPKLLFGYRLIRYGKYWYKIAEPEKALLDFLYLNPRYTTGDDLTSLRILPPMFAEVVSLDKLRVFAGKMKSRALIERLNVLTDILHAESF